MQGPRVGEDVYSTRCATCHTIGQGDKLGPDLLGVVSNRERDWLIRWLQEPDAMLKEKDPLAIALYNKYNKVPMPNMRLSHQDALDLIQFMQEESQRVSANASSAVPSTEHPQSTENVKATVPTARTPPAGNWTAKYKAQAIIAPANEVK